MFKSRKINLKVYACYEYFKCKIPCNISDGTTQYNLLKQRHDHLYTSHLFNYQHIKESHLYNTLQLNVFELLLVTARLPKMVECSSTY